MNKLRALAEAATPGPWEFEQYGEGELVNDATGYIIVDHSIINRDTNPRHAADAAYIAALNPTVALLLADVVDAAEVAADAGPGIRLESREALRAALAKLQEVMP